jgi:hypothetical protein
MRYLYLLSLLLFYSCTDNDNDVSIVRGAVEGYKPIYTKDTTGLKIITALPPHAVTKAGKIYVSGTRLFQVEVDSGVHVIDYTDKQHPERSTFIKIPGCNELAVKGDYLYVNNYDDMVVVDVSHLPEVAVTQRLQAVFRNSRQKYPPERGVLFECVDSSKGWVVDWQLTTINNPKCER